MCRKFSSLFVFIFLLTLSLVCDVYGGGLDGREISRWEVLLSGNLNVMKFFFQSRDDYSRSPYILSKWTVARAIEERNLDAVKFLIEKAEWDVDLVNRESYLLRNAMEVGDMDILRYLIENGKIEDMSSIEWMILVGAGNNNLEGIKYLESKGVNILGMDLRECIELAIKEKGLDTLRYLVEEKGVKITWREIDALFSTYGSWWRQKLGEGDMDMMRYLADKSRGKNLSLQWLIKVNGGGEQDEVLDYLLKSGAVTLNDIKNFVTRCLCNGEICANEVWMSKYALERAMELGDAGVTWEIIGKGGSIMDKVVKRAIKEKKVEFIQYLVGNGAKVGEDHLIAAIIANDIELVRYLIESCGVEVTDEVLDEIFYSYEIGRLREEQREVMKYLVDRSKGKELGDSWLINVRWRQQPEILDYLLKSGVVNLKEVVDYMTSDMWGRAGGIIGVRHAWMAQYVLERAMENGDTEMAKYIIERGEDVMDDVLEKSIEEGKLGFVRYLLGKGVKVAERTLIEAIVKNKVEMVMYFVGECGMEVTDHVMTIAVREGKSMVAVLFERSKELGEKWLSIAVREGGLEVIKYLVDNGVRVTRESVNGQIDNTELIEYFIRKEPRSLNWVLVEAMTNDRIGFLMHMIEKGYVTKEGIIEIAKSNGIVYTMDDLNGLKKALIARDTDEVIECFKKGASLDGYILVGITNIRGDWSSNVAGVAMEVMKGHDKVYYLPLKLKHLKEEGFMAQFSGFINPGAADTFPWEGEFTLRDLDKSRMLDNEHLYQGINELSDKYRIPYLGICSGSQHLVLNNKGTLKRVTGYLGGRHEVELIPGTYVHFLAMTDEEQEEALESCVMPGITFPVYTAHNYAGVEGKLGEGMRLGGKSEEGVVEAFSSGVRQVGTQFHPENYYFNEWMGMLNRQKVLLDHYFEMVKLHYYLVQAGKRAGMSMEEIIEGIDGADKVLLEKIESCTGRGASSIGVELEEVVGGRVEQSKRLGRKKYENEYMERVLGRN